MSTKPTRRHVAKPVPETKPTQTGVDLASPATSTSPAMPHERDEAAGMTGGVPSKRVRQAHADVKRGVQDTSGAPEADTAYRKLKK